MPRSIKDFDVIAFDWDGTLVNSVPYKLAQNRALAHEFGNELTEEEVRQIWNASSGFPDLMANLCQTDDMDAIMAAVKRDYDNPKYAKRPFSFCKPLLERVQSHGVQAALITNATREILHMDAATVGVNPVEDYFAFTQTAEETTYKKPDRRVFEPLLTRLGAMPLRVLYIGDELKDYFAARDAGIPFIGVETGMATAEEFAAAGATCVVDAEAAIRTLEPRE